MDISKKYIDQKANDAATSPKNNIVQPTNEQKKNGNYKKGHIKLYGLNISIENPAGSTRSGTDSSGKKWSIKLKNHYGYINGNKIGKDGDPVDVFIGDNPKSKKVFIVNQKNSEDKFDEHKVLIGFDKFKNAINGYLDNYEKGWDMIMSVHQMTLDKFKSWLASGNTKIPYKD